MRTEEGEAPMGVVVQRLSHTPSDGDARMQHAKRFIVFGLVI